jgi:hypothetical protein
MSGFNNPPPSSEFHKYSIGLSHVGSYQVSSRPFLTSSLLIPASGSAPKEISFDAVSRFVIITNSLDGGATNVPIRFGFSVSGVEGDITNNYAILNNGESFQAEFKVTKVFLMSDTANQATASVIAGLTAIDQTRLASNWSGSLGVG